PPTYTHSRTAADRVRCCSALFPYTATAPTPLSTLSLHDALPISAGRSRGVGLLRIEEGSVEAGGPPGWSRPPSAASPPRGPRPTDRKSTCLNSSHLGISYAVFCLKKKKMNTLRC